MMGYQTKYTIVSQGVRRALAKLAVPEQSAHAAAILRLALQKAEQDESERAPETVQTDRQGKPEEI